MDQHVINCAYVPVTSQPQRLAAFYSGSLSCDKAACLQSAVSVHKWCDSQGTVFSVARRDSMGMWIFTV